MRTKISVFILATASLLLVAPVEQASARAVKHSRHHAHRRFENDTPSGDFGSRRHSREDDCPSRDCIGVNSPGNMGGAHAF